MMTHGTSFQENYSCFFPLHCQLPASYLGLEWLCWRCVRRGHWQWFDPSRPHVGKKLVGYLSQNILGEAGHAQDVIPCMVGIIPEWDKLGNKEIHFIMEEKQKTNALCWLNKETDN